jgi:hypothetical protein
VTPGCRELDPSVCLRGSGLEYDLAGRHCAVSSGFAVRGAALVTHQLVSSNQVPHPSLVIPRGHAIALVSPLGRDQGSRGSSGFPFPSLLDLTANPTDPVQHVTMLWPGVQESTTIGHSRDALAIAGARILCLGAGPIEHGSGMSRAYSAAGR